MAESEIHLRTMMFVILMLQEFFRERPDVCVLGNLFWYYEEGNRDVRRAPDIMVVKGVDPAPQGYRDNFQSWVEKETPCFILEIASESTWEEDQNAKKNLYRDLGVLEYYLYDPKMQYLDAPLLGYRLLTRENANEELESEYEELIPHADGSIFSRELGLILRPEGSRLRLVNPLTRIPLLEPLETSERFHQLQDEMKRSREASEKQLREKDEALRQSNLRAESERQRATEAEQRAETERQRATDAEQRAESERQRALEAEQRAVTERQRAESERQLAVTERQRAIEAENEISRLRQELEELRRRNPVTEE